jgi:hypothetical protein
MSATVDLDRKQVQRRIAIFGGFLERLSWIVVDSVFAGLKRSNLFQLESAIAFKVASLPDEYLQCLQSNSHNRRPEQ